MLDEMHFTRFIQRGFNRLLNMGKTFLVSLIFSESYFSTSAQYDVIPLRFSTVLYSLFVFLLVFFFFGGKQTIRSLDVFQSL